MITAIVLSAGESCRMGTPKALLPVDDIPFIERIISVLKSTRVGRIVVVLGHNADEIRRKMEYLPVSIVVNRDYAQGQLSSLHTALNSLGEGKVDGVLVHLVDHPFLSGSLVDELIERFYASGKLIVIPRFKGKRGHPVIFSSVLFPELLAAPLDQGARSVVYAHRGDTLEIDTQEEGVVLDIDTPEEYRKRLRRG
ncbi:MAG: NTP transferase domain-containing protein [Candidatus Binatia bacterium]